MCGGIDCPCNHLNIYAHIHTKMAGLEIRDSVLFYDNNPAYYIRDYYYYIFELVKEIMKHTPTRSNNTIKIHINYEHTLVVPGGRDTNGSPVGSIPVLNIPGMNYLVRLPDLDKLVTSDIIFDYSIPNCKNVESPSDYSYLFKKYIYVPPLLYPLRIDINNRHIDILTTFINTNEPRRKELLDKIKSNNLPHHNINTCFDKNQLREIYNSTKIMINIHQTDHHHTFEELRVLPALLCGVIVVCEESPLMEHIPYKDYVIWCKYNEVVDLTKHIMDNYTTYYELLFSETKINNLRHIIETLHINTILIIHNALLKSGGNLQV